MIVDVGLSTLLVEHFGYGKHFWDLPQSFDLSKFLLTLGVRTTFTIVAISLTKTAFAITLLRVTEGSTKRFLWFVIISINLVLGVAALLFWVQCSPIEKVWTPSMPGKCLNENVDIYYGICVSSE